MADEQTANQAINVDDVVADLGLVPFERLKWIDFPLETRLRGLRALLDSLARLRERRRMEAQAETAQSVELKAA